MNMAVDNNKNQTYQPTNTTSAVAIPPSQGVFNQSAYQNIDQATYDAVKGIVDNKGLYNNARYVNQTDDYGNYQNAAAPLYDQLRAAGRGDIADGLQGSDYNSALQYLNSIGVAVPPAPSAADGIMDSMNNVINQGSNSQINTGQYITQTLNRRTGTQ